jgi:hypothetical protein
MTLRNSEVMVGGLRCSRCPRLDQDRTDLSFEFCVSNSENNRHGLSSLTTDFSLNRITPGCRSIPQPVFLYLTGVGTLDCWVLWLAG